MNGLPDRAASGPARAAAAAGALMLAACATVPPDAGKNPRDPYERVNRQVYAFNDKLDRYLLKPLAQGYEFIVPRAFRTCINSGFANMGEIRNAINDILQAKPAGAATDTGRLVINSTLGVAGCFDIATRMGLEARHAGPLGGRHGPVHRSAGAGAERPARRRRAGAGLVCEPDQLHPAG